MSLLHRRSDDAKPQQEAVAAPHAAPAPGPPPSTDELDASKELTALRHRLAEGTLTQAEFDARRKELGV